MMLLRNRLRSRVARAVTLRNMAPRNAETTLTFGPIPSFSTTYGYEPATSEEMMNAPVTDCQVSSRIWPGSAVVDSEAWVESIEVARSAIQSDIGGSAAVLLLMVTGWRVLSGKGLMLVISNCVEDIWYNGRNI